LIHNEENEIYTMEIYMDYGLVFYKRTYNKIFIILSQVFPLFKFALFLIKKFTQHIKISFTKRELAELIFERKEINNSNINKSINKLNFRLKVNDSHSELIKEKKLNYNNSNNKSDILKINSSQIQLKLSLHNNKEKNINISNNLNNKSYKPISNKNKNVFKILNHNDISLNNSKRKSNNESIKSKDFSTDSNIKINRLKKRDTLFPYHYFFMDFFLIN